MVGGGNLCPLILSTGTPSRLNRIGPVHAAAAFAFTRVPVLVSERHRFLAVSHLSLLTLRLFLKDPWTPQAEGVGWRHAL